MKRAVLWDSSAVLALLNKEDANHARAVEVALELAREKRPSVMTNYLEAETHALLLRRLGRRAALDWLMSGAHDIVRARPDDEGRGREIIAERRDKDWSLCDAIAFAVVESRGMAGAFSFDRHFKQYARFRVFA
jgi:predicted nucleic acid-binding protein